MNQIVQNHSATAGGDEHRSAAYWPRSVDDVLTAVEASAPLVDLYAKSMEQERRLADELIAMLKSARVYGLLVPRRYGGLALEPPDSVRVVASLAKLNGSVGWNALIGHIGSLIPFLGEQSFCDSVLNDGKDHIFAGSAQPVGRAERVAGGWNVSGVWPFLSGCESAEWIMGACVMMENGVPLTAEGGAGPMVRHCAIPAELWKIHDTWHSIGLRGTGSHHAELQNVFVPDQNFIDFPFGTSFAPDPIFTMVPEMMMFSHAAFAVGTAEGALQELLELAESGAKQLFSASPLIDTERFRDRLGRLGAQLMAARALLVSQAAERWQSAQHGAKPSKARIAEAQQAAVWIASSCTQIVEKCFELAGTSAVYESSPLQRRFRDMRVAVQHAAVHPRNYVASGDAMLTRRAHP